MDLSEILKAFLIESYENLEQMDQDLLHLEQAAIGEFAETILQSVFRTIHTIKGSCSWLGLFKLESIAHVAENLLSDLRDGLLPVTQERISALLATVDAMRGIFSQIEATGQEGDTDYAELIDRLAELQKPEVIRAPAAEPMPPQPLAEAAVPEPVAIAIMPETSAAMVLTPPTTPTLAEPATTLPSSAVEPRQNNTLADTSIRVGVGLLDKLMNLVGELVLSRNQMLQFANNYDDQSFMANCQRLNLITTELQESVMKTRMQPIGNIWNNFPRVVRDLATDLGKQIAIEMVGKETELDKTIIEAIKDPLTHLIRNCVDHGLETSTERVNRGKSAEGKILLRAFHEGGQVNIEISDDGAGIDLEKIKQKILQRELIPHEQLNRMSDREILHLIFLPGFSTATQITKISGRGVGMDVVKTNIEKIGGTIDIQSRLHHGTSFKIKIPLTLAIIPALIVTTGGDQYAIPQVSLLELVRLQGEQALKGIEVIQKTPVYRLRGNLLPLVYLRRELKLKSPQVVSEELLSEEDIAVNIVVLQADNQQFGLVVDEINDTEEIVVKPLSKQLKGIPVFAGATIMGDGKVALILDALGLAQNGNLVSQNKERGMLDKGKVTQDSARDNQALLLFQVGSKGQMAIPLAMVARLEEFSPQFIERIGSQSVVQYRDQIMPLVRVADVVSNAGAPIVTDESEEELLQVIVYHKQDQSVGLIVEKIMDVVDEQLVFHHTGKRKGVLGSSVIQNRVTEMLDIDTVIQAVG